MLADCFAPVCTLVGKTWALHLEKVVSVDREENLRMIAESVAFLVAQGKRVVYDAEHFFDGYRDDPTTRCAACARRPRRAPRPSCCCDTNGGTLPDADRARRWRGHARRSARRRRASGIHCHDDAGCGVANTLAGVAAGRHPRPGHDQRLRRALRQRQPGHDHPEPPAQARLRVPRATSSSRALTATAHFVDELLNFTPDPDQPYVGRNAFAHKGGMHVAGVNADPATFEHVDPEVVGNRRELLISELSGKGTVHARARERGHRARRRRRRAG